MCQCATLCISIVTVCRYLKYIELTDYCNNKKKKKIRTVRGGSTYHSSGRILDGVDYIRYKSIDK